MKLSGGVAPSPCSRVNRFRSLANIVYSTTGQRCRRANVWRIWERVPGLYARGMADRGATILAVDLAWGMLREARGYIEREQRSGIVLMRAAAENLPFHDESIDAVVVGGSFNEMKSIRVALAEANRVVRRGGRMFVMSLSKATSWRGRFLQMLASMSGIKFPRVNEFNALTSQTGWHIANQELRGIVLFRLADEIEIRD